MSFPPQESRAYEGYCAPGGDEPPRRLPCRIERSSSTPRALIICCTGASVSACAAVYSGGTPSLHPGAEMSEIASRHFRDSAFRSIKWFSKALSATRMNTRPCRLISCIRRRADLDCSHERPFKCRVRLHLYARVGWNRSSAYRGSERRNLIPPRLNSISGDHLIAIVWAPTPPMMNMADETPIKK